MNLPELPVHPAVAAAAAAANKMGMPVPQGGALLTQAVPGTPPAVPATATATQLLETFTPEGQRQAQVHMLDQVLHGPQMLFHASGQRALQAQYEKGKAQGEMLLHDEDGTLLQASTRQADLPHGSTRTYYASGQLMHEQWFDQGVAQGACIFYALSGDVQARLHYLNGKLEGEASYYHEGKLVRREHYRRGQLQGVCEVFSTDGVLLESIPYRDHLIHGVRKRYWPSGHRMEEVHYRKGQPVGETQRFDANGHPIAMAGQPKAGLMDSLERLVKGS